MYAPKVRVVPRATWFDLRVTASDVPQALRPLVVVSDDAGLEPATDEAILACARRGVVRGVSVVVGGATWTSFVETARDLPVAVGLHLNLTEGDALAGPMPYLAPGGRFLGDKRRTWDLLLAGRVSEEALEREIRAQWDALASRVGRMAFVNGHNHVHVAEPVARIIADLIDPSERTFVRLPFDHDRPGTPPRGLPRAFVALEEGARAVWSDVATLEGFTGNAFGQTVTHASAVAPWADVPFASGEWMVHPGRRAGSAFTDSELREREVACLCDPALPAAFAEHGWRLAAFEEVA